MLILPCGPCGSGKTWFSQRLAKLDCVHHVSTDAIRREIFGDEGCQVNGRLVFATAEENVKNHLRLKETVIADALNHRPRNRKGFIQLANTFGAKKVAIIFNRTKGQCLENNGKRERVVPAHIIEDQFKKMNLPTKPEVDMVVTVGDFDDDLIDFRIGNGEQMILDYRNFYGKLALTSTWN